MNETNKPPYQGKPICTCQLLINKPDPKCPFHKDRPDWYGVNPQNPKQGGGE